MKSAERRSKYKEYLNSIISGNPSSELRDEAFTIDDSDIEEHIGVIISNDFDVASIEYAMLSDDLRDRRDRLQISSSRSDILKLAENIQPLKDNEGFIFIA